jgi:catechol 1,2-dioxygenase
VTTHLFIAGSPYLDDDTVFGVKQSLIREVQTVDDDPGQLIEFDITLS